jgi:hypothetical protein
MKFLRVLGWLVAAVLILGLLAWSYRAELAEYWVNRDLEARLVERLGPGTEIKGARWKDGMLRVDQLGLGGERWPFKRLDLAGVAVPVDLEDLRTGTKRPRQIEVAEATLARADSTAPATAGEVQGEWPLADVIIERFHSTAGDGNGWAARDVRLRAINDGGSWTFSATGGTLATPGLTPMTLQRLSAGLRDGRWEVGSFALVGSRGGALGGSAIEGANGQWSGEFSWQDLDVSGLLDAKRAEHFTGRASGDAVFKDGVLHGRMRLAGAEMRSVPLLLKLASLFDGENWTVVPWEKIEFQFARGADGRISFYDLDARSPNGLIVRGEGVVSHDLLSATLEVGVRSEGRPWLMAFMPVLFRTHEEGHLWTTVRLGGTPDAPREDLTPRVVAALAAVPASEALEAAGSAAEIPAGAVEAAGSLLRGLLGR